MCTKMQILWTILVLGSLLQCSYAEVTDSTQPDPNTSKASVPTAPKVPPANSTTPSPTLSQQINNSVNSLHTTHISLPTEKYSTTVALTSSIKYKDSVKSIDSSTTQQTVSSSISNPVTGMSATTTTKAATTTEPTTASKSATTTANYSEANEKTTNIDSKHKTTQGHTTTLPVTTTTSVKHVIIEKTTKPITLETSHTTKPVKTTSAAILTSVLTTTATTIATITPAATTPAATTMAATTMATTTMATTTMATTSMATTTPVTTTTTTTTITALKPKMFNRTIVPISTGNKLERLCAQLMELINTTVDCNMVGKEINDDYKFSFITLKVVDPVVEVNKSTDFEQSESIHMTSIAIMASCGALALFLIAFAVYCSCHRISYRKNQQHLTEELQTVENGYHDNPTLEVMEVHPEMPEKKLALNGEFNDSWIVPFDNLAKDDIPEEEDTHL